jgi:hypothetical protein
VKFYIVVDKAQVFWAVNKALEQELRMKTIPPAFINLVWQTVRISPAYAVQGVNVIYLHSKIPEDLLPIILAHEELHLLSYELIKEFTERRKAMEKSHFIDHPKINKWLCETFDVKFEDLISYLAKFVADNSPLFNPLKLLRRWKMK